MHDPMSRQKYEVFFLRTIIELSGELVKELLKLLLKEHLQKEEQNNNEHKEKAAY